MSIIKEVKPFKVLSRNPLVKRNFSLQKSFIGINRSFGRSLDVKESINKKKSSIIKKKIK